MKKLIYFTVLTIGVSFSSCGQQQDKTPPAPLQPSVNINPNENMDQVIKSNEEWRSLLSQEQYSILREKGTERPGTGKFLFNTESGTYTCAACGNELFTSDMKFDSHCGWPSFDKEIAGGKIITQKDSSHGMIRTEIMCGRCGGHLGHLFDDGPTETGMRYCVNSVSLDFKPKEGEKPKE